jgi:hypothetical protein
MRFHRSSLTVESRVGSITDMAEVVGVRSLSRCRDLQIGEDPKLKLFLFAQKRVKENNCNGEANEKDD